MIDGLDYKKYDIYLSRKKILGFILCVLFFTILSVWFIMQANYLAGSCSSAGCSNDPYFYWIVGWLGFIFFGILGLPVLILGAVHPMKFFGADENGFWTRTYGYIEWSNLESVKIGSLNILLFNVKNPDMVLDKLPFYSKFFMNLSKTISNAGFSTSFACTDIDINSIYNLMVQHIDK